MSTTPGRKEQTHERIVEVAARAIRRAGYHGVGVADIMKEAGLTHGGFYAHFASRDALLVEAMQRAAQDNAATLAPRVEQKVAKGQHPFAAFVTAYLDDAQLGSAEHGCVVAALACEMARADEPLRDEARRRVQALVERVRRVLPPAHVDAAPVVAATMVGALQLARTLGGRAGKALLASTRAALISRHDAGTTG